MGLLQSTSSVAASKDATPLPLDDIGEYPVPIYQFSIQISGKTLAIFQTISGMSVKRKIDSIDPGGQNNYGFEFPGQLSYGHITLGSGLTSSDFFYKWMMTGAIEGYGLSKNVTLFQRRPNPDFTKSPEIFPVIKTWEFTNAFPVSWKISDLNHEDTEKIVIESLELSFDYFEVTTSP